MNFTDYNALGQAIDTTWGRSSTNGTNASMSVKAQLLGDEQLLLTYSCIISFGSVEEREREIKKYSEEADGVLEAALKKIKKDFKDLAGRTLKAKIIGEADENWQLLSLGQFSGKRDAYFQKKVIVEVS